MLEDTKYIVIEDDAMRNTVLGGHDYVIVGDIIGG